jgi:hypothetical protein
MDSLAILIKYVMGGNAYRLVNLLQPVLLALNVFLVIVRTGIAVIAAAAALVSPVIFLAVLALALMFRLAQIRLMNVRQLLALTIFMVEQILPATDMPVLLLIMVCVMEPGFVLLLRLTPALGRVRRQELAAARLVGRPARPILPPLLMMIIAKFAILLARRGVPAV